MAEQYTTGRAATRDDTAHMPDPTRATTRESRLNKWIPIVIALMVLSMALALSIQSRNNARHLNQGQNQNISGREGISNPAARPNGPFPQER